MLRRIGGNLAVLAGFSAISFVYFGLPLLSHPGRYLIGTGGQRDPEIFVWSFAWWPHAIGTWTNPFVTHVIYHPVGINLAWTTSVPGLALAFTPVTLLFGPDVSYNVAALLLPALSAWACFCLCRFLTSSIWASLIGGYLFGFSSYMVGHQFAGHLDLTAMFVVPLVALVLLRYLKGELTGRGLAWRLGLLIAFQISIANEIALTLTIVLGLALILAYAFVPDVRGRLVASLMPIVAGYAVGILLAGPIVYYTLTGLVSQSFANPQMFSGDLLNVLLPTRLIEAGGSSLASFTAHFPGNDNERDSYLGLPVVLVVALYAWRARRSGIARFLLALLVVLIVLTAGTALHIDGHRIVALPWAVPAGWKAFNNVLPERFALYASLVSAVIVALWIASARGRFFRTPFLVPLLAVASLVPAVWHLQFHQHPERVAFFSDGLYKQYIPRNEVLAIFPFGRWGDSMLWQAESGFWFQMAEGNMGRDNLPESFYRDPTASALAFQFIDPTIRPSMRKLLVFAKSHDVDRFVSVVTSAYPDGTQMHGAGALQVDGGVLFAPAGGYESLQGDERLVTPGQKGIGGESSLTAVLGAKSSLARAAVLLGKAEGAPAASRLLSQVSSVLEILHAWDSSDADLGSAVDLLARARSALAHPNRRSRRAAAARRSAGLIERTDAALTVYADAIGR
ncbi:MAG TPA: hypothetical protein VG652_12000 [Gaiellaceae bacterium]|nr:hypothetical protein [Gaiellaceae bacterium]